MSDQPPDHGSNDADPLNMLASLAGSQRQGEQSASYDYLAEHSPRWSNPRRNEEEPDSSSDGERQESDDEDEDGDDDDIEVSSSQLNVKKRAKKTTLDFEMVESLKKNPVLTNKNKRTTKKNSKQQSAEDIAVPSSQLNLKKKRAKKTLDFEKESSTSAGRPTNLQPGDDASSDEETEEEELIQEARKVHAEHLKKTRLHVESLAKKKTTKKNSKRQPGRPKLPFGSHYCASGKQCHQTTKTGLWGVVPPTPSARRWCHGCKKVMHGAMCSSKTEGSNIWCRTCYYPKRKKRKESNPAVARLAADWTSQTQEVDSPVVARLAAAHSTSSTSQTREESKQEDSTLSEDEEEESDDPICCKANFIAKQNNKQVLLTMCIGLGVGSIEEEPYSSARQKRIFSPTVPSMLAEILRRSTFLELPKEPKPKNWKRPAMIHWLEQFPIKNTSCVSYIKAEERIFRDALSEAKKEGESGASPALAWRTDVPWLRLYHCLISDVVKEAFKIRNQLMDKDELDTSKNHPKRPKPWSVDHDKKQP
jgi:hypothetical protein